MPSKTFNSAYIAMKSSSQDALRQPLSADIKITGNDGRKNTFDKEACNHAYNVCLKFFASTLCFQWIPSKYFMLSKIHASN